MDADRAAERELAARAASFPSADLLAFITAWEGCCLKPYQDVAGLWTVGVGHLLHANDQRAPITKDEADSLLAVDLLHTSDEVAELVKVSLAPFQRDALVSFAFNVGVGALAGSTLLRMVNSGQFVAAAFEFQKWSKAHVDGVLQTVDGLMARRAAERAIFEDGDYSGLPGPTVEQVFGAFM